MVRSVDGTAQALGGDGERGGGSSARPSRSFEALSDDIMRPSCTSRGIRSVLPGSGCRRAGAGDEDRQSVRDRRGPRPVGRRRRARVQPPDRPFSSSVGMALVCAGHAFGWPVAKGGSRAITDALAAVLADGREDRDGPAGGVAWRVTTRTWCSSTSRRRAWSTSPTAGCRHESSAPTAATATGPGRSRSIWRSRAACRGTTRRAGGPARCTPPGRWRRSCAPRGT